MGSHVILCPDAATAQRTRGGAIYHDNRVFWHPFQVCLHDWLKTAKIGSRLRGEVEKLLFAFNLIGPSDGRGAASWTPWRSTQRTTHEGSNAMHR